MSQFKKFSNDILNFIFSTQEFSLEKEDNHLFYPIDLTFTLLNKKFYYSPIDQEGIPYKLYASVGKQYNPTRVAAYGLANLNDFLKSKNENSKKHFLNCADWFMKETSARYHYHFDWNSLKAPWISCMAQGEAASVLVRAYKLTNQESYLLQAKKSLDPFFRPITDNGVQSYLPDGKSLFIEEYPDENPSHVLNGFLYALIGLIDYCQATSDKNYENLLQDLIESLDKNIHLWSRGQWSLYDIPVDGKLNYCTASYHHLQISQLRWINQYYSLESVDNIIHLWQKGLNSPMVRIYAMIKKITFRMLNRAQR